jgi:hypothetical protein
MDVGMVDSQKLADTAEAIKQLVLGLENQLSERSPLGQISTRSFYLYAK